jgi:hypothetical protein
VKIEKEKKKTLLPLCDSTLTAKGVQVSWQFFPRLNFAPKGTCSAAVDHKIRAEIGAQQESGQES